MHKYFAKTLFLGKKVEFLPECHSTNSEMLERAKVRGIGEGHLIYTGHQTAGKGQRGNVWVSEPGKNLLFSIYLRPTMLLPRQAYLLNILAGMAVCDSLAALLKAPVELKWPNDVYTNDRKICGILVETTLGKDCIDGAVLGIGVNVNQSHFAVAQATSLRMESGTEFILEDVLERIVLSLEKHYLKMKAGKYKTMISAYYQVMRWRGELHHFKGPGGEFEGEIIGIDETGRLLVKTNNQMKRFDVKEITFLF